MRRRWYISVGQLAAAVGAGLLVLAGGDLAAQAPAPRPSAGFPGIPSQSQDEMAAQLLSGPKGQIFRLWQREGDGRSTGGGAALLAVARPQDTWQTLLEIRPSEKGVTARDADLIFGSSNELALAYRWWRNDPRSKEIRLARSDDGGKTWTLPSTSVDGSGKAFEPKIAWGRGKSLVVVWSDERRGNRVFDIYSRRSPDGGVTWEPEQLLSRFPRGLATDLYARPRLVSDGQDRLWVVWVALRSGRSFLYLNRSVDGGRTWTDPVALTGDSLSVFGHLLLQARDRMLVVWQDKPTAEYDRLYAVSSSDAGVTWTAPVRVDHLPDDSRVHASSATALLSPDGEVLVAWQDARNGREDIFLARSADGGRAWTKNDERMDMDEPGTAISRFPKLAKATDGRVAIAWDDDRAGREGVYVRVRSAGQNPEWGPEVLAAAPTAKLGARLPDLKWGPDGLYVVWETWDYTLAPARISKQIAGRTLRPDSK